MARRGLTQHSTAWLMGLDTTRKELGRSTNFYSQGPILPLQCGEAALSPARCCTPQHSIAQHRAAQRSVPTCRCEELANCMAASSEFMRGSAYSLVPPLRRSKYVYVSMWAGALGCACKTNCLVVGSLFPPFPPSPFCAQARESLIFSAHALWTNPRQGGAQCPVPSAQLQSVPSRAGSRGVQAGSAATLRMLHLRRLLRPPQNPRTRSGRRRGSAAA